MRLDFGLVLLACAGMAFAQSTEDPEVVRARAGIERLRALVEAGAAPRAQLERAEEALDDAQDVAFLRKTLYGADLTEDQADAMIAAAARRVERRKKDLEKARQLVQEGVASQLSLGAFLEDLDRSRKEYDLAESRARLAQQLAQMAKAEEELQRRLEQTPAESQEIAERYDGQGIFATGDFHKIERAFQEQFSKPLPVSAMGDTAVHRALGFDHRGRVDVALNPDQPEGVWLREYLELNRIPYFAFRQAVPGKATGAHIHIGPISARIQRGG